MRYSYEYKRKCVELYRQCKWPDTPEWVKDEKQFHSQICKWYRLEETHGPDGLKHRNKNKTWTPDAKYELVSKVLAGHANNVVACEAGISQGLLYQWVRKYKIHGYNGLMDKKKGRLRYSRKKQQSSRNFVKKDTN